MEIIFKTKNSKQLVASNAWIDDTVEEILYGGAKGGGKSYLGCSLIFGDALLYPGTHYFIARKELNDLRKFTTPTIHEVFQNFGLDMDKYAKYNGQDNYFLLYNGSKVYMIACKEEPSDPLFERFGSMQMTRGWIEEGGEIAEIAKSNLWLAIGRWKNDTYNLKKKLLITANPKKGWMKREFVDLHKKNTLPKEKRYIQAFPTDNPYLSQDYVKTLSQEKNKVSRQRLWEGNWDYDEDNNSLVSFDSLTDCFSNTIIKNNQKYMVVDVARLGKDNTVISLWDGLELYKLNQYSKQSTDVTAQAIRDIASKEQIPFSNILIDEDGIGGGVVDNLFGVKGFTANSSPIPTATQIREKNERIESFLTTKITFFNLKAQCGWKLSEFINEHKVSFKTIDYREKIIEELSAILHDREVDGENKKKLIKKDEVKLDIGRSPDIGDVILMRMFFEIKQDSILNTLSPEVVQKQNDMFDKNEMLALNSTR